MPFSVVALLGREAGLTVLREALLKDRNIRLVKVFTHGKLPKAEGSGPRPELAEFERLCRNANVPLQVLDPPEARHIEDFLPAQRIDLMLALSWRFVLSRAALDRASYAVNLHRGELPKYAGVKPVQRAIDANEQRVAITAHEMEEQVDAGQVVSTAWLDIGPMPRGVASEIYAEEIKRRLLPLYVPLVRRVLDLVRHGYPRPLS